MSIATYGVAEVHTGELLARGALGVEVERAEAETGAELEQSAQIERGDVRLRPALAALLDVLLELNPPARPAHTHTHTQYESNRVGTQYQSIHSCPFCSSLFKSCFEL